MAITSTLNKSQKTMISKSEKVADQIKSLTIKTDDDYQVAGQDLIKINKGIKDLEATRVTITKPLHDAKTAVMDLFRTPIEKLQEAKKVRNDQMIAYDRKKEEDRKAIEAAAQKLRDQEEAKELAKAKRKATNLKKKGKDEEAEAVIEEAKSREPLPPVAVNISKPKVKGVHTRTTYSAVVYDKEALVKAIADKDPRALLAFVEVNQPLLNRQATALKEEFVVPGVRVEKKESKTARTK